VGLCKNLSADMILQLRETAFDATLCLAGLPRLEIWRPANL
jgi:hypothetical protein